MYQITPLKKTSTHLEEPLFPPLQQQNTKTYLISENKPLPSTQRLPPSSNGILTSTKTNSIPAQTYPTMNNNQQAIKKDTQHQNQHNNLVPRSNDHIVDNRNNKTSAGSNQICAFISSFDFFCGQSFLYDLNISYFDNPTLV